jgi:dTDP-4-dehydrorhamnose 3,5-epimerase
MRFVATELEGAYVVELDRREDTRGFFARAFCIKELEGHGAPFQVVQSNVAFTYRKGTLRGLHYQLPPAAETKLVRCTQGCVYDVIVDLRPESRSYLQHFGIELSARNRSALLVPPFFAHGYQTLADESEMTYLVNEFYDPSSERGLRYDDPALRISWPLLVSSLSEKDNSWPPLTPDSVQIAISGASNVIRS